MALLYNLRGVPRQILLIIYGITCAYTQLIKQSIEVKMKIRK